MLKYMLHGRRLLLTVGVLLVAVILCGLGVWQVNRLNQRLALIERVTSRMSESPIVLSPSQPVNPDALDYRRVTVRGTFNPSEEILRRNRSVNGVTGYHVVTPLRLSGSDKAVLIDRGWIPYDQATPEQRRAFAPPTGEVTIEGVAQMSQEGTTPPIDPAVKSGQRLDAWFRMKISQIQQQVSEPLLPVFIEQQGDGEASQTLPIAGKTAPPDQGNHLSYAIQWFSFAVILLGGYCTIMFQQWQRSLAAPEEFEQVVQQRVGAKR